MYASYEEPCSIVIRIYEQEFCCILQVETLVKQVLLKFIFHITQTCILEIL